MTSAHSFVITMANFTNIHTHTHTHKHLFQTDTTKPGPVRLALWSFATRTASTASPKLLLVPSPSWTSILMTGSPFPSTALCTSDLTTSFCGTSARAWIVSLAQLEMSALFFKTRTMLALTLTLPQQQRQQQQQQQQQQLWLLKRKLILRGACTWRLWSPLHKMQRRPLQQKMPPCRNASDSLAEDRKKKSKKKEVDAFM